MNRENEQYSRDVHHIDIEGREIILIGTAHISRDSVELVKQVIADERPDCVCIELDEKRYRSIASRQGWESLDLKTLIKKKQLSTLIVNLVLASYQKKLGMQLGVTPGSELVEAARQADSLGIPVALCDRDVRVTLRRAWKATSFLKKSYLLAALLTSLFDRGEITEEKLEELKQQDVLTELLEEIGRELPELKKILIDERDTFLSEKIKETVGKKIVAVVGAGHVQGIKKALYEDRSDEMDEISSIPPVSPAWKAAGWIIPVIILASITVIGVQKGSAAAVDNIFYWIFVNGFFSALGAAMALAHPLTILSAFIAAPITSLTPVIGAGYVTAFVQAYKVPPIVKEFQTAADDIGSLKKWWQNRLLRVFLAFILPGLGSVAGTWLGGYKIVSNIF
jgi:pheromone shutdown-related protein TraB